MFLYTKMRYPPPKQHETICVVKGTVVDQGPVLKFHIGLGFRL